MNKTRKVIGFIAALLFSVLGAVAMPMASTVSHQAEFFPLHAATSVEHTNAHFAARAPPTRAEGIAATGGVTVMHGGAFVTHGVETQWASLNFGADLAATNKLPVPDDLPTNIHMGQQGKHIRGHNNFQEGRSYFNDGVDPTELLAGVHSGQYAVVGTGARGNPIVEFGRPIGVDGRTGQVVTRGQIHYGNNGAHIVPDARN